MTLRNDPSQTWTIALPSVRQCSNMTRAEMQAAIRNGSLTGATLVWRKDESDWVQANAIADIALLLATEVRDVDPLADADEGPNQRTGRNRARHATSSGHFRKLVQRNATPRKPPPPMASPDAVRTAEADLDEIAVRLAQADVARRKKSTANRPVAAPRTLHSNPTIDAPVPKTVPAAPHRLALAGWLVAVGLAGGWLWHSRQAPASPPPKPAAAPVADPAPKPPTPSVAAQPAEPASATTDAGDGGWIAAVVASVPGVRVSADRAAAALDRTALVPAATVGAWRRVGTQLVERRNGQPPAPRGATMDVWLTLAGEPGGSQTLARIGRAPSPQGEGEVSVMGRRVVGPRGELAWAVHAAATSATGPLAAADPPEPLLVTAPWQRARTLADGERAAERLEPTGLADVTVAGTTHRDALHLYGRRTWLGPDGDVLVRHTHSWWAAGVGMVLLAVSVEHDGRCPSPDGCETWIELLVDQGKVATPEPGVAGADGVVSDVSAAAMTELSLLLPRTREAINDVLAGKAAQ